jgi:homoserine kinase
MTLRHINVLTLLAQIGLALSLYLELEITFNGPDQTKEGGKWPVVSYEGDSPEHVSLDPDDNLVTRVALYVLKCHDQHGFPAGTHVHIKNPIPLGRGLGSSGAAVVGGVALGNVVGKLGLSKARMLVSHSGHNTLKGQVELTYNSAGLLSYD